MLITIKNSALEATIDTRGAQLMSLIKDGTENIWERDAKYWSSCCPVLFPMVSAVYDDYYTHNGKTYPFTRHGFARDCEFDVVDQSGNSVVMRLVQNNLTKLIYPFKFDFCVTFTLNGDKLEMWYTVKNTSETEDMYFNTGAHEGYKLLDGTSIDEHYIEFEKVENLEQKVVAEPLWKGEVNNFGQTNILELKDEYFAIDGIFFTDIKSNYVTLKSKSSNKAIRVYFDCDKLGFWKVPEAGYLCIEPWDGFCAYEGDSHELKEKRFIKTLEPNGEYKFYHAIEIM